MARLFFDLLILAALCKEVLNLVQHELMTKSLFLTASIALPFFLGLAPAEASFGEIVQSPIRTLIRNGVALVSLAVYFQLQVLAGTLYPFGVIFPVMIGVYVVGRVLGLAWRAVWFLIGMMLAVYLYMAFGGGALGVR